MEKQAIGRTIYIKGNDTTGNQIETGETVKFIHADEEYGVFSITGRHFTLAALPGYIILWNVPHEVEDILVEVNHAGGQLTRIVNNGPRNIHVERPDIQLSENKLLGQYGEAVVSPQETVISWTFFSTSKDRKMRAEITLQPLPYEHAVVVSYKTCEIY